MLFLLLLLVMLVLTCGATTSGNTQTNGKRSPIKQFRSTPNKDANGGKSTPPARPPTAIDPLSHVRIPLVYVVVPIIILAILHTGKSSADILA